MNFLFALLGWCLLALTLCGYTYVLYRYCKVDVYFAPIVVLSSIALLIYGAGMLGIMLPMCGVITVVGAGYGCYAAYQLVKTPPSIFSFTFTHIGFFLGCFIFAAQLFNTSLEHYDNFTHWAVVVKEMLIENALPTVQSTRVEFYNYPLGTASLIYYVCRVVNTNESTMLLAQALLIFACFYAMFGIIAQRRRFLLAVIIAAGGAILTYFNVSIRMNTLLVDFLLPMLCLAAISCIHRYRKWLWYQLCLVTPILGFLMIVKSTGVLFAAVAFVYLLYTIVKYRDVNTVCARVFPEDGWQQRCKKRAMLYLPSLLAIGVSFVPLLLWNWHQAVHFAGVENKFETSTDVLASTDKTTQEIAAIVQLFFETLTDLSLRPTIGLVAFNALGVVACIVGCCVLKKKWYIGKVLLLCDLLVVGYYAGILVMYIYSMPMDEAIYLAGFERYASSIIILFGGIILLCLTLDIEKSFRYRVGKTGDTSHAFASITTKGIYNKAVIGCALVCFLILSSEYNGVKYYNETMYTTSAPTIFREEIGDNWGEMTDDTYLLYAPDTEGQVTSYYIYYVGRYYLRSNNVEVVCSFYEDNLLNLLSQYDHLVIVQSDDAEIELLNSYFDITGEPGIYDTQVLLDSVGYFD